MSNFTVCPWSVPIARLTDLEGNLYIGTSAAEVLHYVSLPPDISAAAQDDTFILASRTQPTDAASPSSFKGVQQLLILPNSKKACILCNGALTFHTLPELSPAPDIKTVPNVLWIGGADLDGEDDGDKGEAVDFIMMSLRNRMLLLRIGDKAASSKPLNYPGCLIGVRRGRYACVADSRSYALIDLENSQKIPLFPISSLDDTAISFTDRQIQIPISQQQRVSNVASPPGKSSHSRNTSLNKLVNNLGRSTDQRRRSIGRSNFEMPESRSGAVSPTRPSSYLGTPTKAPLSPSRLRSSPPSGNTSPEPLSTRQVEHQEHLQPQIVSPLSTEFLLLTGTASSDPGVGMFVNLDGDVVRGTLEFSSFPFKIVIDTGESSASGSQDVSVEDEGGYLFAAMERPHPGGGRSGFEIHKWDDQTTAKSWLDINTSTQEANGPPNFGVASVHTTAKFHFHEIGHVLRSTRLDTDDNTALPTNTPGQEQDSRESEFTERLGQAQTRLLVWCDNKMLWATRNPVLLQLNSIVDGILQASETSRLDQKRLIEVFESISRQEAHSETEFLSLEFVRQKISIILFADLAINEHDVEPQLNEHLLLEAGTDPRVILSMIPFLRKDISKGPSGIMVHAGLASMMKQRYAETHISLEPDPVLARPEDFDVLGLVKRYLTAWRQKKGFGSIADESQVFASVDAALIHVLLYQDQQTSFNPGRSPALGSELYLIIDNPLDCFDRAIELLEEYRRLYALSRLYQSRRMSRKVLETWRRMLDGEPDEGGGFNDGENEVRKYLVNRSNKALVMEYGSWLARRNPQIGVQVFTDDAVKVRLPPAQVEELLRKEAPDAVKVYLEHLVFGKKLVRYADELISYYLDNVLTVLEASKEALALLANSYQTYRALSTPKPTYRQFITDNAIAEPWWQDRLRLLELLGGSYGAGFSYNVPRVLERIEPFEEALVPESIILEGRQGQHLQALRLLIHGLGDYHTAILYCQLGGSSIFHPAERPSAGQELSIPDQAEQTILFQHLFTEFLAIASEEDRIERTSELLNRFGEYFDLMDIVERMPADWSVENIILFLTSGIRNLTSERNESLIVRALSGVENLKISHNLVEKIEKMGAHIIPATDTPASMS